MIDKNKDNWLMNYPYMFIPVDEFIKQGENTRHFSGEMNRQMENIHMG